MKVLLLGENGQLGWELKRSRPEGVVITTCDYPEVDFLRESSLRDCVGAHAPDWVINAAAYTAVDKAEDESAQAFQVNCNAVAILARLCRDKKIRLVHISTDFVFSGEHFKPYGPGDMPDPVSVYGESKLGGEKAVGDILGDRALIVRTAWLYSAHGTNFVKTMLRLMGEKDQLGVVYDQIGTPTWAGGLARGLWAAMEKGCGGLYHWTDAGVASWYDFAVAIQEEALALELLKREIPILPIPGSDYPTPAKRPHYSVLDSRALYEATGLVPVHWRKQLRKMLKEVGP